MTYPLFHLQLFNNSLLFDPLILNPKPLFLLAFAYSIINHIEGDIFFILGLHKNVENRYLGELEDLNRLANIIAELIGLPLIYQGNIAAPTSSSHHRAYEDFGGGAAASKYTQIKMDLRSGCTASYP